RGDRRLPSRSRLSSAPAARTRPSRCGPSWTRRPSSSLGVMSLRPIRLLGDPVLRTPAQVVTTFDKELRTLVKDLTDTMLEAPGVGLAAPQLGVSLRVFTYDVDDVVGHLINP